MNSRPRIAVVMPTFNGSSYLADQVRSVLAQSEGNFILYARDDCSTDGTGEILERLALTDDRIRILPNNQGRLGAKASFNLLLERASQDADLVLCCDQDDVWDVDKISRSVTAAQTTTLGRPGMLFTDFRVVDATGTLVNAHGFAHGVVSRLGTFPPSSLFGFDYVWGCTTVSARELLDVALPIPPEAENHDYWLALVASTFGELHYLDHPTLSYRKHSSNVTGGLDRKSWRSRWARYLGSGVDESVRRRRTRDAQVVALRNRLLERGLEVPTRSAAQIDDFITAINSRPFRRFLIERRIGVIFPGPLQALAHCVVVFRMRSTNRPLKGLR